MGHLQERGTAWTVIEKRGPTNGCRIFVPGFDWTEMRRIVLEAALSLTHVRVRSLSRLHGVVSRYKICIIIESCNDSLTDLLVKMLIAFCNSHRGINLIDSSVRIRIGLNRNKG